MAEFQADFTPVNLSRKKDGRKRTVYSASDLVQAEFDGFVRTGASKEAPVDDKYDPSQYSVSDVLEYLDTADDGERKRVLKAEASGKGRASIANFA